MFILIYLLFFIFNNNCVLRTNAYYWHQKSHLHTYIDGHRINENYSKTNTSVAIQHLSTNYALACPIEEVYSWSCKWCSQFNTQYLKPYNFIKLDNEIKAGVLIDSEYKEIIVAFNYTISPDTFEDIVYTDCSSRLFNHNKRICIGNYYEKVYNPIREPLYNIINKIRIEHQDYKFIFTGYSLGAAISTIAALDLKLRLDIPIKYVYTFGSPRVGNIEFTKFYYSQIKNTFRMTYSYDPIPRIPSVEKGFNHISSEVWQLGNRIIYCLDTEGLREYDKCINTISEDRINFVNHCNYMNLKYNC